jgi:hypothetical protein
VDREKITMNSHFIRATLLGGTALLAVTTFP